MQKKRKKKNLRQKKNNDILNNDDLSQPVKLLFNHYYSENGRVKPYAKHVVDQEIRK